MFYRGLVCGTLLLALAACSGPDAPATETPRAVKLERFGAGSDSHCRCRRWCARNNAPSWRSKGRAVFLRYWWMWATA